MALPGLAWGEVQGIADQTYAPHPDTFICCALHVNCVFDEDRSELLEIEPVKYRDRLKPR